ncbi:hypothetical protein JTB14_017323 [Gonioctena quinquepunctata]|nr:hypothetical protein JTB14_017323 [Gonioctena quinquepunctata]
MATDTVSNIGKSFSPAPSLQATKCTLEVAQSDVNKPKENEANVSLPDVLQSKSSAADYLTSPTKRPVDKINILLVHTVKPLETPIQNDLMYPVLIKRALFWPDTNNNTKNKTRKKEKIPTVVTSELWQEYKRKRERKLRAG